MFKDGKSLKDAKQSSFSCSWWYLHPAVVAKGYSARGCFSAVPICFIARQLNLNTLYVSRSRKSLSYLLRDRLVGLR